MANGILVVDRGMDSRTSALVIIISIVGRSHRDVVACCICLCLFVYYFVSFVWGGGCRRVVIFRLFMYLAVFFMSLARYQEQPEILGTCFKRFEKTSIFLSLQLPYSVSHLSNRWRVSYLWSIHVA